MLIPYALKDGRIVHVDSVARGRACGCACPACDGLLIARKGNHRTHHFAHDRDTVCDGESALHATAKLLLFQLIQDALREKREVPLSWQCRICPMECQHTGNLIKRTTAAALEQIIPEANIRPDILLSGENGTPAALLEIAYTNTKPLDGTVIRYAKDHNLPLLEFNVKTTDDLGQFRENALMPQTAYMTVCPCLTCRNCGESVCDPDKHCHCPHCDKLYNPSYGPNDGHYFCKECQECVDASSDFQVFHWHCSDCGQSCYGRRRYARCFCCFNERKFGVKCTARNRPDHRHCRDCGRVFNHRGMYEVCYNCNQTARAEAIKVQEVAQIEQKKVVQEPAREHELKRERERHEWAALQRDLNMSIVSRQGLTEP